MMRFAYSFLFVAVFVAVSNTGKAQDRKVHDALMNSTSGALGTEFVVAFPCNDNSPFERNTQFEIYIATSADAANVRVRAGDDPAEKRFQVLKNRITTMSLEAGEPLRLQPSLEIRALESEVVTQKGVVITSDEPISVYVLNAKTFSSDGYLAIPTSAWGRRYMPICYFDFKESNTRDTWAGGFVVIAKDDDTDVTILLRGEGGGIGRTRNGKRIGESFTINMRRGETYQIMGDGTTRGEFDLTGSLITSTKPIGLISFHSRTMVPNQGSFNGRDPLYEMIPPVSAWGKKYVSVEYNRNGSNNMGKGDYYRILAAEDGTVVTGRYLHKVNKSVLGTLSFPDTMRSGEFRDFAKTSSPVELPNGVVIIEANKPIFVMQYNCSAAFDGDQINDPFMINVTPMEQYISGTISQTPDVANFTKHYLTVIVEVLHPETEDADLKSLAIDGIFVYQDPRASIAPQLLTPQSIIPPQFVEGRRVRHCSVVFGERGGTHIITSNGRVRFGGYIFGNGSVDSYGWPAASDFANQAVVDTMPPAFTASHERGSWLVTATETRNLTSLPNGLDTHDSAQVDSGIASIELDSNNSSNYRLRYITDPAGNFSKAHPFMSFDFALDIMDTNQSASAVVRIADYAGNATRLRMSYDHLIREAVIWDIDNTTSVQSESDVHIQISPIPASSFVQIRGLPSSCQIDIVDVTGHVRQSHFVKHGHIDINVRDLATGVYVVRCQQGRAIHTAPLIISR
jgi:hypothetical protein